MFGCHRQVVFRLFQMEFRVRWFLRFVLAVLGLVRGETLAYFLGLLLGLLLADSQLLVIRLQLFLQLLHLQTNAYQPVPDMCLPRFLQYEFAVQVRVRFLPEYFQADLLINRLLIDLVRVLHVTRGVLRIVLLLLVELVEVVLGAYSLVNLLVIVVLGALARWDLLLPRGHYSNVKILMK